MYARAVIAVWMTFWLAACAAAVGCSQGADETEPLRTDDDADDDQNPPPDDDNNDNDDNDTSPDDDDTSPPDDDDNNDTDDDDDDDNDDDNNDDNDNDDDNNDDTVPVPEDMIVDEDADGYTDLALDSLGAPHIVYFRQGDGLMHAYRDGGAWSIELVDDFSNKTGMYAAITMDATGDYVLAAYQDGTAETLRFAEQTAKGWSLAAVDVTAGVGAWCDVAVNGTGDAYVSYYDATNGALKLARRIAAWETETVADGAAIGQFTSLGIDSGDTVYISFFNEDLRALQVARGDFGAWTIDSVDLPGGDEDIRGQWTSLIVDDADDVHVAYQDFGLLDLKYALYSGGGWTVETVDGMGNKGADACVMVDAGNRPHIVYQDGSTASLRHAAWDGAAWTRETLLDGDYYVGMFGFWLGCTWQSSGPVVSHYYETDGWVLIYPAFTE